MADAPPTDADPPNDAALFDLCRRELFTAVVGDVLDAMGERRRFLPPDVRPVEPGMVVVGRAMPVVEQDLPPGADPPKREWFGRMFEALDDLRPGEVYLCAGRTPADAKAYALWGELMTTRAMRLGAAGAVVDGFHRDTAGVLSLGLPVFSRGAHAQDQGVRGKVVAWREPVEVGGVAVEPGDLIVGDRDGVVVVPRRLERDAVAAALEKVRGENRVRDAIRAGMSTSEAWRTFGIM